MDDINLKLYLSDEEWFLDGIKQLKNPDNCFDILNWYRNLYYKEDKNTEHGKMAWTINEVLMKLKELDIDLYSLSDEDKEDDNNKDNNKDDRKDKDHKNNDNEVFNKNNVTVTHANNHGNNPKQKRKRGKRRIESITERVTSKGEKAYVCTFKDTIIGAGDAKGKQIELIR